MSFSSYSEFINSNSSEKIILAHMHGSKRLYNFSIDGSNYSREVDNFVSSVTFNSTLLSPVNSIEQLIDETKFFYDVKTNKLYLYNYDQDSDEVIVEFKFFLSNLPINLSSDLSDSGEEVYYEPRIIGTPKIQSQMSQGKKGINLIGQGDLTLNNNDGFYDSVYDTLFWENKRVYIYSFNRDLAPSQAQVLFRGVITGKNFSTDKITFNLNDDLYSLEQLIPSTQYGESVTEEDSTNYKRVVYGRVNNLQVQSLDKYGEEGISISGTLSGISGESYITGTNTQFINELSKGDTLNIGDFSITVDEVKSNNIIKTSELERTFYNLEATVKPDNAYWNKNRQFQVCGHAIKRISTTITQINSRNRFQVSDSSGFEAGDLIDIDGEEKTIRRVSGSTIVLTTNYNSPHSISDTVTKKELFNVRYDVDGSINSDEVTINNSSNGTTFLLSDLAEINSSKTINLKQAHTFISGSSGIWLGSPARHRINLSTGNKFGKYFTIYDVEGESTAFWFKDTAPESSSAYQEPNHGADNSISISLQVNNPDITTLQNAILNSINGNTDQYYAIASGSNIILESINPEPISTPSSGSSGFSMTSLTTGSTSNYKTDLTKIIKPRDFIQCPDGTNREVLEVFEKSIKLRDNYVGTSGSFELNYKNVNYINDDSTVFVDCYGKTKDNSPTGDLIATGAEVVEDILKSIGLSDFLDSSTFENSSLRSSHLISLAIPYSLSESMPTAKDAINKINRSIMGSILVNNNLELGYDILDSEVPLNVLETISDEDVIKWSVSADSFDVVKKVIGNYGFVDYKPSTENSGSFQVSYNSDFVSKYINNDNTKEVDLYLFNEADAQEAVERDQFINSLSNSTIKVSGSLNLKKYSLGERVLLNFNRLYIALGSSSNALRVGVISSIKQTGEKVEMEIEDVGALYSRAARITDNSAEDYSNSTDREKVINSFIVDDNEIIGTDEDTFSTNLIS